MSNNDAWPIWYKEEVRKSFQAEVARVFLLHGDIVGLLKNPNADDEPEIAYGRLQDFLWRACSKREMVLFYDVADGFRFKTKEMEDEFKKINGLLEEKGKKDDDDSDPVAKVKAKLKEKRAIPKEPNKALELIQKVLQEKDKVAVIIKNVDRLVPAGMGAGGLQDAKLEIVQRIENWTGDRRIKGRKNIVFMTCLDRSSVAKELREAPGVRSVFIAKPNEKERLEFWETMLGDDYKDIKLEKEVDTKVLAAVTRGMHLGQLLNILRMAEKGSNTIDLQTLKREKIRMLNEMWGDLFEIIEPERGFEDIGGLKHVKDYFGEVIAAMLSGDASLAPMGCLAMGPPGTGKTAIVEALAKALGFLLVKIKNLRSMWVGESESRAERMMQGLRELAPIVVMNDEADLAEAGRDSPKGDSGVSERLMKMWMEFLSDPKIRGKVFVVSCTNRPDRLDAALKRDGRTDDRFLMAMPSEEERKEIFAVMFKRYKIKTDIVDFDAFANSTASYSGANIESIVINANRLRNIAKQEKVTAEMLQQAVDDKILSASQLEIDRMTLFGILESSSRRLLPKNIKELLRGIIERNLVPGLIDIVRLIQERKIVMLDGDDAGEAENEKKKLAAKPISKINLN